MRPSSGADHDPRKKLDYQWIITEIKEENVKCLFPPHEDPMSWHCDCYQKMQDRCDKLNVKPGYEFQICLRAQFCIYPGTCDGWKEMACQASEVQKMIDKVMANRAQASFKSADKNNDGKLS